VNKKHEPPNESEPIESEPIESEPIESESNEFEPNEFKQAERTPYEAYVLGYAIDDDECRQLLHYLCHDITLSLATVRTLAELASGEPDVPPPVMRRLQQVASEAKTITALCGNVLDPPKEASAVRLDLVAAKAVESARLATTTAVELCAEPVEVLGHSSSIWRLITNLVDNACRVAGPRGNVRVSVGRSEAGVYLDVADSGHDRREGTRERRSSQRHGPPLGLRIVGEIVEAHSGLIQARRSELGGTGLLTVFPNVDAFTTARDEGMH
jgi:K+-sensing histidine kinase KdpD